MKRSGLAGYEEECTESRAKPVASKIDTLCRSRVASDAVCRSSGRFNGRGIHQQNRDVVLNGIHAAACAALQALPIRFQDQRLFAHGTNQNVEQILRNHNRAILTPMDSEAALQFEIESHRIPSVVRGAMAARILDGNKMASEIRGEVAAEVKALAASGLRPGLAVVLVGSHPASEVYVRGKVKSSEEVGIYSEKHTPAESVTTEELLALIADLNRRDEIDGILVQLPLPPQVNAKAVLLAVDPSKDVDGFHPMNVGYLSTQRPGLVPCTPAGVMEILKRSGIPVVGQEAVVVGRSDIVGKPVAMLLLNG